MHLPAVLRKALLLFPCFSEKVQDILSKTRNCMIASDTALLLYMWLKYCPLFSLSQAQMCKGRIPKNCVSEFLLRSAEEIKGKSILMKEKTISKKPSVLKTLFAIRVTNHQCQGSGFCSNDEKAKVALSCCYQPCFHRDFSAKSSGLSECIWMPLEDNSRGAVRKGEREKKGSHKSFFSLCTDVCTANNFKSKNNLVPYSWTDFGSWEWVLFCCRHLSSTMCILC